MINPNRIHFFPTKQFHFLNKNESNRRIVFDDDIIDQVGNCSSLLRIPSNKCSSSLDEITNLFGLL